MSSFAAGLDPYFGIFVPELSDSGVPSLVRHADAPSSIPDPQTGRLLRISTLESRARAICPSCEATGEGGFISFVGDLRLAYACPSCVQLVWLPGA
jgi:hypothetical protein